MIPFEPDRAGGFELTVLAKQAAQNITRLSISTLRLVVMMTLVRSESFLSR